jgi:hypothetical protein
VNLFEFAVTERELLLAVTVVALAYVVTHLLMSRRKRVGAGITADQTQNPDLHTLLIEVERLQHRLDELETRLGATEVPETESAYAAYDYAVQYARQGMIAPEIAARCGISRDEAALIVAMHRKDGVH